MSTLLDTVSGINLNTTTPQPVYEVPEGKTLLLLDVAFSYPTPNPFEEGNGSELRVYESAGGSLMASSPVADADRSHHYALARVNGVARLIKEGAKVQVAPDVEYGSENTCTVNVIGILFDAE